VRTIISTIFLVLGVLPQGVLAQARLQAQAQGQPVRIRYNFNPGWLLHTGDIGGADAAPFDDASWQSITLPHAFNEDDAFKKAIQNLTTGVAWYRKHWRLAASDRGKQVFLEFEGSLARPA
jgi:beta-galactosidase